MEGFLGALDREVEELTKRKTELQTQLVSYSSSDDDLLACYPAYEFCGSRPLRDIRHIPLEQVGNIDLQLHVATDAIHHQNKMDTQTITELKEYIKEQEKMEKMFLAKDKELCDKTGFDFRVSSAVIQPELINSPVFEGETAPGELEVRKKLLAKEIKAAASLVQLKGKTIEFGHKKMEEREEMIKAIDMLYNDLRVADRDMEIQENQLVALRTSEEDLMQQLEVANGIEGQKQMLVDNVKQLVLTIREEREGVELDKCEPQERLLKAQDYRLQQLKKRLHVAEKCLQQNCSIKDVNAIMENKWLTACPETFASRDDLMDLERVIPAEEKIHPALYNLFLREKERLSKSICKMNVVAAEKESVMASQSCRLEALSRACNNSIQELDDVAAKAAFAEEKQRREVFEWARQQRAYYCELLQERNELYQKAKKGKAI